MMTLPRRRALALALSLAFAPGLSLLPAAAGAAPAAGVDRSGGDPSVRPQDDLFRAVNGEWLKTTPIPADRVRYGSFYILEDKSDEAVRGIVEGLAAHPQAPGSVEAKVGDFYTAFMDTAAIDKAGLAPLAPWFAELDAVHDAHGLVTLMGRWQGVVGQPLELRARQDADDPTTYTAAVYQGGLGLPDRDYYLKDDERFAKARTAYTDYLTKLFTVAGDDAPAERAAEVFAFEKRLAQIQWSKVDNRDPLKTWNPTPLETLVSQSPAIDWKAFAQAAQMPLPGDRLVVGQPSYIAALSPLFGSVPLATWKAYLRVHAIDAFALELPASVREASYAFHDLAIQGRAQDLPRWHRATDAIDQQLGEAVGQVYVQRYFPAAYKARMLELVHNLLATYKTSIDQLTWMSPATKAAAQAKLAKYGVKIGYPDKWRDYARYEVKPDDALGNEARGERFEYLRQAVRVGKPVDRDEWGMTPQTVNAYYSPQKNEIVFPAAILQPPFFDADADDATNYGAIGAVIGHEISHGFDDQGSRFDGDGRLRNWWTADDRKAFEAITSKLVAQYDAYEPLPGLHVNGKLTLGENIADLSGLQIAYKAYERSLGGKPSPVIDGLTGEQRFYLAWSRVWREKSRDTYMQVHVTTNPHSPNEFRANGAAMNADGFHEAFKTKPGDGMWKAPADRLRLW